MNSPLISYLVTTHNEGKQLKPLFKLLSKYMDNNECVILDDFSDRAETMDLLEEMRVSGSYRIYQHKLNGDYAEHKNSILDQIRGKSCACRAGPAHTTRSLFAGPPVRPEITAPACVAIKPPAA